jgi:hypothetical protein
MKVSLSLLIFKDHLLYHSSSKDETWLELCFHNTGSCLIEREAQSLGVQKSAELSYLHCQPT